MWCGSLHKRRWSTLLKGGGNTRRVNDMRHYNDQNPNINPARTRARAPQMVREDPYKGQVRTILVSAPASKKAGPVGRKAAGLPIPVRQAVGRE